MLKRHGFMLSTIYLEGDFCCLEVLFRGIDITVNDNVNDITHKEDVTVQRQLSSGFNKDKTDAGLNDINLMLSPHT